MAHKDSQETAGWADSVDAVITSRFLFVDVAAQRAKQLRRGALARLEGGPPTAGPHKLERVAMEEVRTGMIPYTLPTTADGSARDVNKA